LIASIARKLLGLADIVGGVIFFLNTLASINNVEQTCASLTDSQ